MEEIWKDVKEYEGLYQVSNMGRVKNNHEKIRSIRTRKDGYQDIALYKNKNVKYKLIHRLVAEAFLHNPDNKKTVNHKDGDKTNNKVNNLEWSTASENTIHAYEKGLINTEKLRLAGKKRCGQNHHMYGKHHTEEAKKKISKIHKGPNNHMARKIICITTGEIFDYINEAEEKYGVLHQNISKCCKGQYKSAGKHPVTGEKLVWKYIED